MSSAPAEELIEVRVGLSIRHVILAVFCHGMAFSALFLTSLNSLLMVLFCAAVICHGFYYCRLYFLKSSAYSVLALRVQNDVWYLKTCQGWRRVWPVGEKLVLPWLICLRFKEEQGRVKYYVNLFSDSDDRKSLHSLRLRLMLQGEGA
jgi:hypothetical protein